MANNSAPPISSKDYIKSRTGSALCIIISTALAGFFITVAGLTSWRESHPIHISVNSAEIVDGSLVVEIETELNSACMRVTSHSLYNKNVTGQVTVWPLAFGLTGLSKEASEPGRFRVVLPLPKSIPDDVYYSVRGYYECWPAGMVKGSWVTPPLLVDRAHNQKERLKWEAEQ